MIKTKHESNAGWLADALSNKEGCMALEAILACPHPQMIVSKSLIIESAITDVKSLSTLDRPVIQKQQSETSLVDQIKAIWQEVLGVKEITAESDFFALGGDSLSAIQLSYKLKTPLGIVISPDVIIDHSKFEVYLNYITLKIAKNNK
jgi:acyl carrier protein